MRALTLETIEEQRGPDGAPIDQIRLTPKTMRDLKKSAGIVDVKAKPKTNHRQTEESDIRNACALAFAARSVCKPDPEDEYYMPANMKMNVDVTQWLVGDNGGSRKVCTTREALDYLLREDQPIIANENKGREDPFFVSILTLTNADGYVPQTKEGTSGVVFVVKAKDQEQPIVKLKLLTFKVKGLSPYGPNVNGEIWLINYKHGPALK